MARSRKSTSSHGEAFNCVLVPVPNEDMILLFFSLSLFIRVPISSIAYHRPIRNRKRDSPASSGRVISFSLLRLRLRTGELASRTVVTRS